MGKSKAIDIEKEPTEETITPKPVRRIGTMNTEKYLAEAPRRTATTPDIIGVDYMVMQIAKGMGRKIYNNPIELAESLQGFEDFCKRKNLSPSFVGLAIYLNISKSSLLKYFKDETEYTVMVVRNTITGEYIYSHIDKDVFNKYINSVYEKDKDGNNHSIKEYIDNGVYYIEYKTITFADVLAPIRSLIELSITNKGFEMKNPAFAIFLAKNKFGETTHYTDEQTVAIETHDQFEGMDDAAIKNLVQSLPDDESGIDDDK